LRFILPNEMNDFYQYALNDRRRLLADAGFSRDDLRIWRHPNGRAIGESVAMALTDAAFFRYLGLDPLDAPPAPPLTSAETADIPEIG
jgi:hypothetical protein